MWSLGHHRIAQRSPCRVEYLRAKSWWHVPQDFGLFGQQRVGTQGSLGARTWPHEELRNLVSKSQNRWTLMIVIVFHYYLHSILFFPEQWRWQMEHHPWVQHWKPKGLLKGPFLPQGFCFTEKQNGISFIWKDICNPTPSWFKLSFPTMYLNLRGLPKCLRDFNLK